MNADPTIASMFAARLSLSGHVQGIGMRPQMIRLARRLHLCGFVRNTSDGVQMHVEGSSLNIDQFIELLPSYVPSSGRLTSIRSIQVKPEGFDQFDAILATEDAVQQALSTPVPVDLVVCDRCCDELANRNDRRFAYSFTSCTDCGPRYSIIDRMPYERERTSMSMFDLCESCQKEYESPEDRRFRAQTNACQTCGPHIWARDASDRVLARGGSALDYAAAMIRKGHIVALKGIGGYQLLVDATSQQAVQRLRQRKSRGAKPFAVVVASLDAAEKIAHLDDCERKLLTDSAGPIVIVASRQLSQIATSVAGGIGSIGIMLPTTPLHWLLLRKLHLPLVCTSGNLDGEPIVYRTSEAIEKLQSIADLWIEHDRSIQRPIDDSVIRVIAGRAVALRLARGYAPVPLELQSYRSYLAVGGNHKTAVAISNGVQAVLGPHIGDQDSVAARERLVQQIGDLKALYGLPQIQIVGDLHPDYFTTQWADSQTEDFMQVQHHHAHVAAGMLEHGWLDRQVLGVAFDGTGFGGETSVWGGEFLLCTASQYQRVGHIRSFALPGGEQAVRQPWRIASVLVQDAVGPQQASRLGFQTGSVEAILVLLKHARLSPTTTSVGRLFDGVAALVLGIENAQFEGEPAIMLEAACDHSDLVEYPIPILRGCPRILDWRPMIRQLICDREAGHSPGSMAMRFHRGLANAIARFCKEYSALPVVFGGGVFQNRVLVELVASRLTDQPTGLPGIIPPGDGGLAAGQLAIATALAQQGSAQPCV
jgi:hydrogenase maturation protein HypF